VFIPVLHSVPGKFTIHSDGGRTSVTIPLTTREDDDVQVALDVRLWRAYWHGVAMHEFKFAIVVRDAVTDEIAEIFDRNAAADYIAPVRRLVLPCVCSAAKALVETVRPDVIYRATYLTRPPPDTLSKHRIITDTIVELGYQVLRDGTDPHGRRFWLMAKSGDR